MLKTSLPRVFNNSCLHVVFISDHPPCFNEINYWWITPTIIRSSLVTNQPIFASPLPSYPAQTSCLSLVEVLTDLLGSHTNLCTGYMIRRVVAKRPSKCLCVQLYSDIHVYKITRQTSSPQFPADCCYNSHVQ